MKQLFMKYVVQETRIKEVSLTDFCSIVREIRYLTDRGKPELGLFVRGSQEGFVRLLTTVPLSAVSGEPERVCDWEEYAAEHMGEIYEYLIEKGELL